MSQLYLDFKKYRDQHGLNQLESQDGVGIPTQNGALFTMEYLICLLEDTNSNDNVNEREISRIKEVLNQLEEKGLTFRHPLNKTEWDSMDNLGSLLVFSGLFDNGEMSKRILKQGQQVKCTGIDTEEDTERNKKWYWLACLMSLGLPKYYANNQRPEKFTLFGWYGRSPGFVGLIKLTAKKFAWPHELFIGLITQFLGMRDNNNIKLAYINWYFLTRATPKWQQKIWSLFYRIWVKRMKKLYPGGMRQVYCEYYQDPNHPIRKYSKEHF